MHNLSYTLTYDLFHNTDVKLGLCINKILNPINIVEHRGIHFSNGIFDDLILVIRAKWYHE